MQIKSQSKGRTVWNTDWNKMILSCSQRFVKKFINSEQIYAFMNKFVKKKSNEHNDTKLECMWHL